MQIFHNYIRPHMALDGQTRSEVAGIKVEGENKRLTLIQNASNVKVSLHRSKDWPRFLYPVSNVLFLTVHALDFAFN